MGRAQGALRWQLSQMGITDDEMQLVCAPQSRSASVTSLASSTWRLAFEVKVHLSCSVHLACDVHLACSMQRPMWRYSRIRSSLHRTLTAPGQRGYISCAVSVAVCAHACMGGCAGTRARVHACVRGRVRPMSLAQPAQLHGVWCGAWVYDCMGMHWRECPAAEGSYQRSAVLTRRQQVLLCLAGKRKRALPLCGCCA
jgi:hypothetical protein